MAISTEQFEQMVSQHTPMLLNLSKQLTHDRQEAEDMVQETFSCVWQSKDKLNNTENIRGLLTTILRRRTIDNLRKPKLPISLGLHADEIITYDVDPSQQEFTSEITTALNSLPSDWKNTILMVVVDGYTHQEVADQMGVPLGTVLSRVSRAKNRLRQNLTP